jgi:hypothetical protein
VFRPVKNRDGPIAGIPHTGGGGSRQSGPDDNDPVSATQIPAPPNHTIFLPPHNPSITIITTITHDLQCRRHASQIPILASEFNVITSSNALPGLATIRER